MRELSAFNPIAVQAGTGSIYISFDGIKIKQIRIANHNGRKVGGHRWEVRTDASNKRLPKHRIYNSNSVMRMCSDFKSINQGV